jgi:hypothetical protein
MMVMHSMNPHVFDIAQNKTPKKALSERSPDG